MVVPIDETTSALSRNLRQKPQLLCYFSPLPLRRVFRLYSVHTRTRSSEHLLDMANSLCFAPACSVKPPPRVGAVIGNSVAGKVLRVNEACIGTKAARFRSLEVKAAEKSQGTKPRSIVCANCDGNGAVQCSQCEGTGVNSVDHFNGQFKAGAICWLCRGKREMLCGDCNGAGFLGGFMSTFDE